MQRCEPIETALRGFYERRSAADASSFDEVVSAGGLLMIGTSPDEWFDDREELRSHFAVSGLTIEAGPVRGYADGPTGWAVDTPRLVIPDGRFLATRLLAALHHEDGAWKVAAMHFSVGVADEDTLQSPA